MSTESDALLHALKDRAIAKRNTRAELRANRLADKRDVPMEFLKTWPALSRAEQIAADALMAWEKAEGVYE